MNNLSVWWEAMQREDGISMAHFDGGCRDKFPDIVEFVEYLAYSKDSHYAFHEAIGLAPEWECILTTALMNFGEEEYAFRFSVKLPVQEGSSIGVPQYKLFLSTQNGLPILECTFDRCLTMDELSLQEDILLRKMYKKHMGIALDAYTKIKNPRVR